ncbi:TPA: hypothetical protein MW242_002909 [Acinetobacter baumannii]|nr:hypothetical protein [Acinetobacter baumannii]
MNDVLRPNPVRKEQLIFSLISILIICTAVYLIFIRYESDFAKLLLSTLNNMFSLNLSRSYSSNLSILENIQAFVSILLVIYAEISLLVMIAMFWRKVGIKLGLMEDYQVITENDVEQIQSANINKDGEKESDFFSSLAFYSFAVPFGASAILWLIMLIWLYFDNAL